MIVRKSAAELEKMRRSGLLVWEILGKLASMIEEGVTTLDLEVVAERMIRDAGAKPAFKGYYSAAVGARFGFVLCTSVNEEIVHGMPSAKRALRKGDIISIDTGVQLDGYFGDSAVTIPVGEVSPEARRLLDVTRESLELAIDQVRPGKRLFDVCGAVERYVVSNGFSVVREFVGHGIGTQLHEEPQVPNYVDRRNENPRLKEGMVLAIEPMVNAGKPDSRVLADKWTAVTRDGSYSAHFEHCVAVTPDGAVGVDTTVNQAAEDSGGRPEVEARVVELLPRLSYRVELDNGAQALVHPAGEGARNFVRIRPGDRVAVELSPHDPTRGRLVRLLKG